MRLGDFKISGCSASIECPDATSPESLFADNGRLNFNEYYQRSILPDTEIRFLAGWCTNDQSLLYQNLEHIEFVFDVNGKSYSDDLKSQYQSRPNSEDATQTDFCYLEGAVAKNWKPGSYDIQFGIRINSEIFDSWDTYSARDLIRYYIFDVE